MNFAEFFCIKKSFKINFESSNLSSARDRRSDAKINGNARSPKKLQSYQLRTLCEQRNRC